MPSHSHPPSALDYILANATATVYFESLRLLSSNAPDDPRTDAIGTLLAESAAHLEAFTTCGEFRADFASPLTVAAAADIKTRAESHGRKTTSFKPYVIH